MAEEWEAGATVGLPFGQLDLVVDALAAVVVGQGQCRVDGGPVAFKADGMANSSARPSRRALWPPAAGAGIVTDLFGVLSGGSW